CDLSLATPSHTLFGGLSASAPTTARLSSHHDPTAPVTIIRTTGSESPRDDHLHLQPHLLSSSVSPVHSPRNPPSDQRSRSVTFSSPNSRPASALAVRPTTA